MSNTVTQGIRVRVESEYVSQQSDPRRNYYFFIYHVELSNEGELPAQLVSRHWVITDGHGNVNEVRGPGVVGVQPLLRPGDTYRYTSACPLPTAIGSMRGSYQMRRPDGTAFDAQIGVFTLADPLSFN